MNSGGRYTLHEHSFYFFFFLITHLHSIKSAARFRSETCSVPFFPTFSIWFGWLFNFTKPGTHQITLVLFTLESCCIGLQAFRKFFKLYLYNPVHCYSYCRFPSCFTFNQKESKFSCSCSPHKHKCWRADVLTSQMKKLTTASFIMDYKIPLKQLTGVNCEVFFFHTWLNL